MLRTPCCTGRRACAGTVFRRRCSMGGKNKKHRAPGAAAVRAAVSASRAKAADAGAAAAAEAQTQKPVARPPAAAGPREPRARPGTSGRRR